VIFSFDVEVSTHDLLKAGVTAMHVKGSQHTWHRIVVEAPDHYQAWRDVTAMASCHGMVTRVLDRI
jgi:hypothetical protein